MSTLGDGANGRAAISGAARLGGSLALPWACHVAAVLACWSLRFGVDANRRLARISPLLLGRNRARKGRSHFLTGHRKIGTVLVRFMPIAWSLSLAAADTEI